LILYHKLGHWEFLIFVVYCLVIYFNHI